MRGKIKTVEEFNSQIELNIKEMKKKFPPSRVKIENTTGYTVGRLVDESEACLKARR